MTRLAEATEALKGHFEEQRGRDLEEIRKVGYRGHSRGETRRSRSLSY